MANETMSNALTRMGEFLEKILHIHKTKEAREQDLETKLGMIRLLIFEMLFTLPVTPDGETMWYWCSPGIKVTLIAATVVEGYMLFADLHPEADFGEFFDEDGYDAVVQEGGAA